MKRTGNEGRARLVQVKRPSFPTQPRLEVGENETENAVGRLGGVVTNPEVIAVFVSKTG